MTEQEITNALVFGTADEAIALLKEAGAISQACNDEKEAYEQATGGW